MNKLTKCFFVFAVSTMVSVAEAQQVEEFGNEIEWHLEYFTGYLTGSSIGSADDESTGSPDAIKLEADGGAVVGVRYCGDGDRTGIEYSLMIAFSGLDKAYNGDFVTDPGDGDDLTLFIGNVNWLWYFGDNGEFGNGSIRLFATVGAGLGYLMTDYDYVDSELLYNFNAGFGCKYYINQSKTKLFRIDWRWHVMEDFSSTYEDMYQQEITAGIHYAF